MNTPRKADAVSTIAAFTHTCGEFRARVVDLHDRGLTTEDIISVVNVERMANLRDGEWFDDERGPAYNGYYRPRCGDIGILLDALDAAVAERRGRVHVIDDGRE